MDTFHFRFMMPPRAKIKTMCLIDKAVFSDVPSLHRPLDYTTDRNPCEIDQREATITITPEFLDPGATIAPFIVRSRELTSNFSTLDPLVRFIDENHGIDLTCKPKSLITYVWCPAVYRMVGDGVEVEPVNLFAEPNSFRMPKLSRRKVVMDKGRALPWL